MVSHLLKSKNSVDKMKSDINMPLSLSSSKVHS